MDARLMANGRHYGRGYLWMFVWEWIGGVACSGSWLLSSQSGTPEGGPQRMALS